jgi:hypothetical protein
LWLAVAFYAAHILEEFTYDWKSWVKKTTGLPVDWQAFYITNAAVIILGISCAEIGWRLPEFSLIYPALMVINAIFFHLSPTFFYRRYSPGLITALIFFLPLSGWLYYGAYQDNVLTGRALLFSTIGGVLVMAYPFVLMKTAGSRLFRS